jgi:hypothetical protein
MTRWERFYYGCIAVALIIPALFLSGCAWRDPPPPKWVALRFVSNK